MAAVVVWLMLVRRPLWSIPTEVIAVQVILDKEGAAQWAQQKALKKETAHLAAHAREDEVDCGGGQAGVEEVAVAAQLDKALAVQLSRPGRA